MWKLWNRVSDNGLSSFQRTVFNSGPFLEGYGFAII
jgi:hypothetical protein